jgi:hypothetical protein
VINFYANFTILTVIDGKKLLLPVVFNGYDKMKLKKLSSNALPLHVSSSRQSKVM